MFPKKLMTFLKKYCLQFVFRLFHQLLGICKKMKIVFKFLKFSFTILNSKIIMKFHEMVRTSKNVDAD